MKILEYAINHHHNFKIKLERVGKYNAVILLWFGQTRPTPHLSVPVENLNKNLLTLPSGQSPTTIALSLYELKSKLNHFQDSGLNRY